MFEDRTYETLLEEALSLVAEDIDKQEGSILRTAVSPCIYKLAELYVELDNFLDLVSGDAATGEYLDRVVADYGITRKAATHAVRQIEATAAVDIGSRWSIGETTYKITSILADNVYLAECEQSGSVGNKYSGSLEALDSSGTVTAVLSGIIESGEEEETDDNLRERFFVQVQSTPTSGNSYHYKKWALEVTGVGDARVFPLWHGAGTVKVVIANSDKQPASSYLVSETADYIEEVRPIGAAVTVVSGTAKTIGIAAKLVLASGYSLSAVTESFTEALTEYFKEITFLTSYISYAKIGTILLAIDGILDYTDLQLNNNSTNIILEDEEIPDLGTVELEV